MLNAGLSTLIHLKSRILPAAAATETTWDAALGKLGLAIAARMEAACNRKYERTVGAVDTFSAWTLGVTLKRYPVETITTVQVRDSAGLLAATTDYTLDADAGMLSFGTVPGTRDERLVITYTGGFWLDPLTGATLPAGATALPDDLLELWLAEVQAHAEARGLFGALGLRPQKDADKAKLLTGLSENMISGLAPYRRFAGE